MEYARNVLGLDPQGSEPVLTSLSCSLVQESRRVFPQPDTRLRQTYGLEVAVERFNCSFGLNEAHREAFVRSGLVVSALGREGEVRAVELPSHPFFAATLFMPQLSSAPDRPHPLMEAFVTACLKQPEPDGD